MFFCPQPMDSCMTPIASPDPYRCPIVQQEGLGMVHKQTHKHFNLIILGFNLLKLKAKQITQNILNPTSKIKQVVILTANYQLSLYSIYSF